MAGIETSLRVNDNLEVCSIRTDSPADLAHLRAFQPDVIVFEATNPSAGLELELLRQRPNVRLVGVDAVSTKLLLLDCRCIEAYTVADLVNAISTPAWST